MKCPKCEYLSFEAGERCRNCGYEFSLSSPASTPLDLPLALDDLPLADPDQDVPLRARQPLDLDRIIGGPEEDLPLFSPPPAASSQRPVSARLAGLPIPPDAGEPLITVPSRPRAPLSVRRTTPEISRARTKTSRPAEAQLFEPPAAMASGAGNQLSSDASATPARRIAAALVDGALLFALDAAVLYFTLRLCDLSLSELQNLPVIPLLAFFMLLNGGYLVAFTAVGGQSIGKMAAGIKVVSDGNLPVPFGRAALRTLAYLVSALPCGAGFLPGVMGADRLALHDRLAHTRVVRPSAV